MSFFIFALFVHAILGECPGTSSSKMVLCHRTGAGYNHIVVNQNAVDIGKCSGGKHCVNGLEESSHQDFLANTFGFDCDCADVDACLVHTCTAGGDTYAECVDTQPPHADTDAYSCVCSPGFSFADGVCHDIDECLANPCDANAACENTIGSFTCECNDGFSGDGLSCEDIDECLANPCDVNAACENTIGSFTCECNGEYLGDGLTCSVPAVLELGSYMALTGTGWNKPGSELKHGAGGLVGHQWGELMVAVDFGVATGIISITNRFASTMEVAVSADGEDWTPVATLPQGEHTVGITAQHVRVSWILTQGRPKTVTFVGAAIPGAPLSYTELWAAGPAETEERKTYEQVPDDELSLCYDYIGEGTLVSESNDYYRVAQYRNLGSSPEEVQRLMERVAAQNEDVVGFHIQKNRGGRYLQAALLLSKDARFPPRVRELAEAGGVVTWYGWATSEAEAPPALDRASAEVGKGWQTWSAYAKCGYVPSTAAALESEASQGQDDESAQSSAPERDAMTSSSAIIPAAVALVALVVLAIAAVAWKTRRTRSAARDPPADTPLESA